MRLTLPLAALLVAVRLPAQHACPDPHYRWSEKEDVSLATKTPKVTTVTKMLAWDTLDVDKREKFWCANREKPESTVYAVTGWVRRVRNEEDGDWHIEITSTKTSPVTSCVVVEIPPASDNLIFAQARQRLEDLLNHTMGTGDYDPASPVRVKFVGPAFFDGEHRKAAPHRDQGTAHGRCNKTVWELHPVYWVLKPSG